MIGTKPVDLCVSAKWRWRDRETGWFCCCHLQLHEKYLAHTDRQTVRQTDKHSTISTRVLEMRETLRCDMSYFAITIQHSSLDWGRI
jgi:hypothetical protein